MIKTTHQIYRDLVFQIMDDIAKKRKKLGLSYEKMADLTKISRPGISRVEQKQTIPNIITLLKICSALGISLGKLIAKYESNLKKSNN